MEEVDLEELYEKIYTPERIRENDMIAGSAYPETGPYLARTDGRIRLTLPLFDPLFRIKRETYNIKKRTYTLHIEKSSLPIAILPGSVDVYMPGETRKVAVVLYT